MSIKESAALAMCGGMLGNCYLLAEMTENMMVDTIAKFKQQKWFRQEIKKCLNMSHKELHSTIVSSISGSPTNSDYMREAADAISTNTKQNLFKLKNAISLELNRKKIAHADLLTEMLVIDIMFKCISVEYDDVIEYMKTIFAAYYDSWYYHAKCVSPAHWWNKGMQTFASKFINEMVDISNTPNIQNGVAVIQKKMHSAEIADIIKEEATKYADEGEGRMIYNNALKILGRL